MVAVREWQTGMSALLEIGVYVPALVGGRVGGKAGFQWVVEHVLQLFLELFLTADDPVPRLVLLDRPVYFLAFFARKESPNG